MWPRAPRTWIEASKDSIANIDTIKVVVGIVTTTSDDARISSTTT